MTVARRFIAGSVYHTGLRPKGRPNTVGHESKPGVRLC